MTQNEHGTVDGFNATAYGAVIGKDIPLTDGGLFGAAFAAGEDNLHGRSVLSGQSLDSNAYQGMLYGVKKFAGHFYLAGEGLLGYEDNDTKRSLPLFATTEAKGSYNSWFTNLRAQLGSNIYALQQNLVLTPELDASYLYTHQGSYREFGSPMDLSVNANNNSSLVLGAYGHAAYHLISLSDKPALTLTGYVGIADDALHSQPQTTATFVAGGPSFSTYGVPFNRLVFRGGVGLTCANLIKRLTVNVNYDLQAGNDAYSGAGAVTIAYKI